MSDQFHLIFNETDMIQLFLLCTMATKTINQCAQADDAVMADTTRMLKCFDSGNFYCCHMLCKAAGVYDLHEYYVASTCVTLDILLCSFILAPMRLT